MKKLPKTIEEAIEYIIKVLPADDKRFIQETPEKFLTSFHYKLGEGIRNDFDLEKDNPELLEACGTKFADDASDVIMLRLWERLNSDA